jgi:phosphoglycerate dehydrogenase-like enzyme
MDTVTVAVAPGSGSAEAIERLRAAGRIPVDVELVELSEDGRAEGDAARATVLWLRRAGAWTRFLSSTLDSLPDLRWVHTDTVGINHLPVDDMAARDVTLTNGSGNFARPMAEWVLLAMLAAAKQLPKIVRDSQARIWDDSTTLRELEGSVALLLGLGATNELVAQFAVPFGVEVRAAVRRTRATTPRNVGRLVVGDDWRAELPEADWVVLGVPLTPATERMIDAEALAAMKPGAWLINVARGALVDEDALAAALDSGQIGGAVLDAFVQEPLPTDSTLWARENVVVVPHHTWSSEASWRRMEELFGSQLSRWVRGEPMDNVIDPETGY